METVAHRRLKGLALAFLRKEGCLAVAREVRCPINRYRVDAAGYRDRASSPGRAPQRSSPRTVVIECKQARGDFLRDQASADRLLAEIRRVEGMARSIEQHRIMPEEPHLRREGSSLFPQMEDWDFARSRLPAYRRVLSRLGRLSDRLYGDTKFCTISRYRLADELWVAAPQGMVRRHELPQGWGLLECPPSWLDDRADDDRMDEPPMMSIKVPAPSLECEDRYRNRLLRNIAVAASLRAYRMSERGGRALTRRPAVPSSRSVRMKARA